MNLLAGRSFLVSYVLAGLSVCALLVLSAPAKAAAEPSMAVPGPGCPVFNPEHPELCGVISLPGGGDIHYYFELGTTGDYDSQIPTPPGTELNISADDPSVMVHVQLDSGDLRPNTTYFYRLAVLDSEGPRYGAPATFTTPETPAEGPGETEAETPNKGVVPPIQVASPSAGGAPSEISPKPQKLVKALKKCRARPRHRAQCERQVRRRLGATSTKTK